MLPTLSYTPAITGSHQTKTRDSVGETVSDTSCLFASSWMVCQKPAITGSHQTKTRDSFGETAVTPHACLQVPGWFVASFWTESGPEWLHALFPNLSCSRLDNTSFIFFKESPHFFFGLLVYVENVFHLVRLRAFWRINLIANALRYGRVGSLTRFHHEERETCLPHSYFFLFTKWKNLLECDKNWYTSFEN